jgi:2-polyprenyl-6-methoxyphenol hydroxylase-like FAD-dependent oxidoreductase
VTTSERDVVVLGGGLGGLAAAIALARRGLGVAVFDSRPGLPRDFFGYTLWPPATRVLRELGVFDELATGACTLDALRWYDSSGGQSALLDLTRISNPGDFLGTLPSRVQKTLEQAAEHNGVEILRGVSDWRLSPKAAASTHVSALGPQARELKARIVLGCDGSDSLVRRRLKLRAVRWRPPRQHILTGIGGRLPVTESHQTLGHGWSSGCLSLGEDGSWLYGIAHRPATGDPAAEVRAYTCVDPAVREAANQLTTVASFRPWSVRVPRWARDGALLMGDAAHAMLPHLGLGGSLTLEDVPVMADVVVDALARNDVSARALGEFQRLRARRVAYATRVSELWALATTAALPGVGAIRDVNLRRMTKDPGLLEHFVSELASAQTPSLRTRLSVLLP